MLSILLQTTHAEFRVFIAGTTNLHLDMSDAANVMVYVGIPRDGNCQRHIEEALNAVEEAGCDAIQMKRVRERGARVGAVWHIFNAQDAEPIRQLLRKVTVSTPRQAHDS